MGFDGIARVVRRIRGWLWRGRVDAQLRDEIEHHIELRRRQLQADGMDSDAALSEARRRFGNPMRLREEAREMWSIRWLDAALQDLRYAVRLLARAPGFAAVAVLSLSLGIGAAAAVFNVADAVLFRPLPVKDPGRLRDFRVRLTVGGGSVRKDVYGAEPSQIDALRRSADFADLFGFRTVDDVALGAAGGDQQLLRAEFVSPEYFGVLGLALQSGRGLDEADRAASPVPIVVTERWWRTAMGADPSAIGRALNVNRTPAVLVGVVREFRGMTVERPADVFLPLESTATVEPAATGTMVRLAMRLRPGVTTTVAEQRLTPLYRGLGPSMARSTELQLSLRDAGRGVSDAREELRWPFALGMALVGVLLLAACANAGGLLIARFAARQTEFGIRVAIGAGRARLVRQLIVEAMVLAAVAALTGLMIARTAAPVLAAAIPFGAGPVAFEVRFDWRLIAFTAAVSAAAALIAGGMSLRHVLGADPARVLNAGTRWAPRGRRAAMDGLIAAQIGCALLLLIVTGAMGRTLINLRHVDPGFDPSAAINFTIDANAPLTTPSDAPAYFGRLYDRVSGSPEVGDVTLSHLGLLTRGMTTGNIGVAGWSPATDEDRWVRMFFVGPRFFETVGMRMIAGDSLGAADMNAKPRVAVVSGQLARLLFGSPEKAIGRFVNRDVRIVGVVADARYNTFRDAPARAIFYPYTQAPPRPVMTLIVRPAGDHRRAIAAVVQAISSYDPQLKVTVTTLADQVMATMGVERFTAAIAAALTLLALCLSCAGVYSTVACAVSERRKELAIRLVLGASAGDVLRVVVRDPLRLAILGIGVAVPCAYALMRMVSALLFGVSPFDLPTIIGSAAALMVVAAAAAVLPAWRAASIDPQECLRST